MTALEIAQITAPFLAAAAAVGGVSVTVRQKDRSERRSEWWRRATWALDRTRGSEAEEIEIGWSVLDGLARSGLATATEEAIVEELAANLLQ